MIIVNNIGGSFGDFDDRSYLGEFFAGSDYGSWEVQAQSHPALPGPVGVTEFVYDYEQQEAPDRPATQQELLADSGAVAGSWENPPPIVLDAMLGKTVELDLTWQGPLATGELKKTIGPGTKATRITNPFTLEQLRDPENTDDRFDDPWIIENGDNIVPDEFDDYPATSPMRRFLKYAANSAAPTPGSTALQKFPSELTAAGSEEWMRQAANRQNRGALINPDISHLLVRDTSTYIQESRRLAEGNETITEFSQFIEKPFGDGEDGNPGMENILFEWETVERRGIKLQSASIEIRSPLYVSSAKVWLWGLGASVHQSRDHSYFTTIPQFPFPVVGAPELWMGPYTADVLDLFPPHPAWSEMLPRHAEGRELSDQFTVRREKYRRNYSGSIGFHRWRSSPPSSEGFLPDSSYRRGTIEVVGKAIAKERYPVFQPKL